MDISLSNLLLALAINELIHVSAETAGMRAKVKRLATYIAGKPYKETKLNINTRAKSYGLSLVFFIVPVSLLYFTVSLLSLSTSDAIVFSIIALLLAYIVTAANVHEFHIDIERITKPFKNKQK